MKFILGKKIGMSQLFTKEGQFVPVTLIEAGPCYVLQRKGKDKDGYEAAQIGYEAITKAKKIKKTAKGKEYKFIREKRIEEKDQVKLGDKIDLSAFKEQENVTIVGTSKGKGFQGAMKLHNFKGKMASHGTKHEHRTIGSIGSRWPQRVVLGKRMPGRMGGDRTTIKNLKIVKIDLENNLLILRGAVPGKPGTMLQITGR